jgi:hypothetical protein
MDNYFDEPICPALNKETFLTPNAVGMWAKTHSGANVTIKSIENIVESGNLFAICWTVDDGGNHGIFRASELRDFVDHDDTFIL